MQQKSYGFWTYLVLCLVALLPFTIIPYPPITDLPNHAARLYVECNPQIFAQMHVLQFGFIPNLALDLLGLPMCNIASPEVIVRGATAGAFLCICLLIWEIRKRLHGGNDALILVVPAIALNVVTTMGYVNFLIGIVGTFVLVLTLVTWPNMKWGHLFAITTLVGSFIFFAHIFALLFTQILTFGWLWQSRFRERRWAGLIMAGCVTVALFAVPLMFVALTDNSGQGELNITYWSEIRLLLAPLYSHFITGEIFLITLVIGAVSALVWTKGVKVMDGFQFPLGLLLAACLVLPSTALEAVDINVRLMVPLVLLAVATSRIIAPVRPVRYVHVLAVAALCFHLGVAWFIWRPFSQQVSEFRSAMAILDAGAPVLSVTAETGPEQLGNGNLPYWHLVSYAEIDQHIFNPLAFSGKGMQPLSATPAYQSYDVPVGKPLTVHQARETAYIHAARLPTIKKAFLYAANWPQRFPFVIYYHFGENPNFDPARLYVLKEGSFFSILAPRGQASTNENHD